MPPGVLAATAAGAVAIVGISVGVSLGAIAPALAPRPAAAPDAAATGPAAGATRRDHGTANAGGSLGLQRSATAAAQHGRPGQKLPAAGTKLNVSARRHPAGRNTAAPGRPAAPAKPAAAARPAAAAKPYMFYDSVTPQAVPAGAEVATYATGARPVPPSAVAGRKNVLWIDTLGTDPAAQVIDVEPGAASPSQVPGWVSSRLRSYPGQVAIVYTSLSQWPQIQADVAGLPSWMRSRIRWWVADPTGSPHIVPGSQATQWYWGSSYDISMAEPNFDKA